MYDLYDLDSIEMPRRQIPPAGMPRPAWSNSGELFAYGDVHDIANKTGLEPNQVGVPARGGTCECWKSGSITQRRRPMRACGIESQRRTPNFLFASLPQQTLPETKVKELRRAYYAAYSHMDSQLERVLDRLLASKFANNTVISFWGDHGACGTHTLP
jgi:predicted AlkP superfamily pyrophosphatase or phosphodiesterase